MRECNTEIDYQIIQETIENVEPTKCQIAKIYFTGPPSEEELQKQVDDREELGKRMAQFRVDQTRREAEEAAEKAKADALANAPSVPSW